MHTVPSQLLAQHIPLRLNSQASTVLVLKLSLKLSALGLGAAEALSYFLELLRQVSTLGVGVTQLLRQGLQLLLYLLILNICSFDVVRERIEHRNSPPPPQVCQQILGVVMESKTRCACRCL